MTLVWVSTLLHRHPQLTKVKPLSGGSGGIGTLVIAIDQSQPLPPEELMEMSKKHHDTFCPFALNCSVSYIINIVLSKKKLCFDRATGAIRGFPLGPLNP